MSSFSDISQETQVILNTIGSRMQPSSIERLWELISWWCASGNFQLMAHFLETIFWKLFQESYGKISLHKEQLFQASLLLFRQLEQNIQQPQQNMQQPQQNMQQPQQNMQQPQQNMQQPQQNMEQPQQNIQNNQQLRQDSPPPGGNETPQQTQQRLRLSQRWWQEFQDMWWYEQQQGWGSQQEQNRLLMEVELLQLGDTHEQLWHRLQQLQQRLQQERQHFPEGQRIGEHWQQRHGNQYLPQQLRRQQGEPRQYMEELLILACQVLTALPEDDTLMSDLVDGIIYADVAGVPIEKAASYLSSERLNHVIRALEAEIIRGDFTLAAETLRKLTRDRSLQDLNVLSILQAVKGDARKVWSLTELPEPLKELFHVPFQGPYMELKQ